MLTFTERAMRQEKGEVTNCHTNKKVCLEQRITGNWLHCTLPMYCLLVEKFFSVKLIILFDRN